MNSPTAPVFCLTHRPALQSQEEATRSDELLLDAERQHIMTREKQREDQRQKEREQDAQYLQQLSEADSQCVQQATHRAQLLEVALMLRLRVTEGLVEHRPDVPAFHLRCH